MSDLLAQMAISSAARAAAGRRPIAAADLDRPAYPLRLDGFDVIAEIKNRSPAEGLLAGATEQRSERAARYVAGGAAAISVLTEPDRFDGDLAHLREVATAVAAQKIPVMCKDFLVDPQQILEAKANGASGVLLIAAMHDDGALRTMLDCAFEHGLFVLLESFDEAEMRRSVQLVQKGAYRRRAERNELLLGVNTRNLRTLVVEPRRLRKYGPLLPDGVTCVAESGLNTAKDVERAAGWGYAMALVGTALMRAADPAQLIRDMLKAGRTH